MAMSTTGAKNPHYGSRTSRPAKDFVRAYMACEPCRRTKAKCDVPDPAAPCVKCTRERRECYFDTDRSAKRRRKVAQSSTVSNPVGYPVSPTAAPVDFSQHSATNELAHTPQKYLLSQADRDLSTQFNNDVQPVQKSGATLPSSSMGPGQQQSPAADGSESRSYNDLTNHRNGAPQGLVQAVAQDSALESPHNQTRSRSTVDADVMRTYLSSSRDALGVLFQAAEQQEGPEEPVEHRDSNLVFPFEDSPASAYTSGTVPAPIPASKLSSPAPKILEIWDACRFIRQGWFTAREAVTYIDLFFSNLSSFSPILDSKYAKHENHETLIYQEPLLCCTILMISSRYHVLPGAGGASRAHFIHARLWTHCEHLIKRLTFGQEKYSVAKSRTVGSIESLLLMTEWHPRALHFPPENDGWDSSLGATNDDTYYSSKRNEEAHLIRWREEVFEPAKRSDRMSWMLLGLANMLGHELGVWDNSDADFDTEISKNARTIKLNIRRLLFIYVNQLSLRIGCTSVIQQANSPSPSHSTNDSPAEKDRQAFISHWMDITKLLKTASEMFFPSRTFTRELLATGRYVTFIEHFQPLIQRWHESFSMLQNDSLSEASKQVLLIDYQYLRMYINSLGVQAVVDRLKNQEGSSTNLDYDFLDLENSQDYKYVQEVTYASREILQSTVVIADAGVLRYAPVRVFIMITSASIFLLKAISLGARNVELQKSLDILDKCIRALRSSTLDDIHLSSRYGMLLERHVTRFRQNFRVLPKSATGITRPHTPNAISTAHLNDPIGLTSNQGNISSNSNSLRNMGPVRDPLDSLVLGDDWLAQPFDPSVAPFGMGANQTGLGFEVDALDFLWNLEA